MKTCVLLALTRSLPLTWISLYLVSKVSFGWSGNGGTTTAAFSDETEHVKGASVSTLIQRETVGRQPPHIN